MKFRIFERGPVVGVQGSWMAHDGKASVKFKTQRIPGPASISCCSGGILVTLTRNMTSSTLDIFFRTQHEK